MSWAFVADVASKSSDKVYTVKQNLTTGEYGCDCPAWRFNKARPRTCKHTRLVEKQENIQPDTTQPVQRPTPEFVKHATPKPTSTSGFRPYQPAGRRLFEID